MRRMLRRNCVTIKDGKVTFTQLEDDAA